MSHAATIAEFGTSLAVAALGISTGSAAVLVPVATLAAAFAAIRHKRDPAGRAIKAAQAALQDAPDFSKTDLNAAAAWLASRPPITLNPTDLAAHKGDLPAYLTQLLDDGTLPHDGATRRIIHLCLTAAHNAVRSDAAFHAPFTQDMLAELAKGQGVVTRQLDQLLADTADIKSDVAELKALLVAQAQRDQPQLYAQHSDMLIALARNYATGPITDFESAYRGLENALRIYDEMRRDNALPRNAADHLDAVMQRVQALNEAAEFEKARAELQAALAAQNDQIAQAQSGKARILDRMVAQAALQNAPADAVAALLERLAMDAPPDPFAALRKVWKEWYHRYQSHAVPFDGQVALLLARETLARAGDDTQRGTAQADLGNILQNLGLRAGDAAQLKAAVDAYETASTLCESRLERAIAYMNIAAALRHLGLLEDNKQTLWNAVAACRKALNVFTKNETRSYWESVQINLGNIYHSIQQLDETTSLDFEIEAAFGAVAQVREKTKSENPIGWANIQNSLGSAYSAQGHRDQDLTKLHAAAQAFSEALNFYPDSETYHWATTQSNLGATLLTIGQIERDEGALNNAAKAFRCALSKLNQQDTPKDWASTITNLANLDLAYFDLTQDPKHLASAQTHAATARAVFTRLGAQGYLQKIDTLLDEIARKST